MTTYNVPVRPKLKPVPKRTAVLIASGDFRQSANAVCWLAQQALERDAMAAFKDLGWTLLRNGKEQLDTGEWKHGFIDSQAAGREAFTTIHPDAPLVVAEAVWQYSEHVLIGLARHRGPILLLANWSGQWPGLVGVLNLRASLSKAGVEYSILWGEDFGAPGFRRKLARWLDKGSIKHDLAHVHPLDADALPKKERKLGQSLAADLLRYPALMGCLDEGCMGMFNAIIPDHLLHPMGVHKERLSQSALYADMLAVPDAEADAARAWCESKGMRFQTGPDEATDLTDRQVREQMKMYIAAARMADRYALDAIGIQYQLGLVNTCAASDVAEGLLNCSDRPPVHGYPHARRGGPEPHAERGGTPIRDGRPIPHFNEVDECAGLDAIITDRVWRAMGLPPDNTLHDLRWGDRDQSGTTGDYVWVFEISGAVPPSHFVRGYADAVSVRQPPMYFLKGGGSIKGVSKPGEVVWSRIFVENDRLNMDLGRCKAVELPPEETERRWQSTTPQWPVMHAVTYGVSRDQMMARHRSNHIQVVYAPDAKTADRALAAKAAMADAMGLRVFLCGDAHNGRPLPDQLAKM